jgi:hypothetical protein
MTVAKGLQPDALQAVGALGAPVRTNPVGAILLVLAAGAMSAAVADETRRQTLAVGAGALKGAIFGFAGGGAAAAQRQRQED